MGWVQYQKELKTQFQNVLSAALNLAAREGRELMNFFEELEMVH
jgi:hypothetical protein